MTVEINIFPANVSLLYFNLLLSDVFRGYKVKDLLQIGENNVI